MATTRISWADAVLNAATGCTEVSAGCDHCYARVMAERLKAMGQAKYANGFEYAEHRGELYKLLDWKKPKRIFVNSMSDFFHEEATWEFVRGALKWFCTIDRHTYLILTKRPGKMRSWVQKFCDEAGLDDLPPHIWLGVSTEDQAAADLRIPVLLQTRCQTRFISAEPLLGPINVSWWLGEPPCERPCDGRLAGGACYCTMPRLSWVITGGESGHHARPMDLDWARSLRDQCLAADVAFFHKQGSGPWPGMHREIDGRLWHQFPTRSPR